MQESRCVFVNTPPNLPIDQCNSTVFLLREYKNPLNLYCGSAFVPEFFNGNGIAKHGPGMFVVICSCLVPVRLSPRPSRPTDLDDVRIPDERARSRLDNNRMSMHLAQQQNAS